MKKIFLIALAFMTLTTSHVYAADKKDDVTVKINGMVCDFCAQSLTKVFTKEDSVNAIDVSLDDQTVVIDTVEGKDISDDKIKELVEWGGYDLVSIKRN